LILEEYSPGVDIEKDILRKMEFNPIISSSLRQMDERIFKEDLMGLANEIV
jgi:acyl CoA:acetate/3-ketoacid CoA transferase